MRSRKISASSSGKIDIYEYLTGEEILPSNQKRNKKQATFIHSPLGKAFEKQAKEQVKLIKDLNISGKTNELKEIERIFLRNLLNDLIRDKMIENIDSQDNIELDKLDIKIITLIKSHYQLYF